MIESLFGKDNNIILIILVVLILFSDELFGKGGHKGKGGFLDDNLIILGILIFFLLQDDKGKGGKRYSIED